MAKLTGIIRADIVERPCYELGDPSSHRVDVHYAMTVGFGPFTSQFRVDEGSGTVDVTFYAIGGPGTRRRCSECSTGTARASRGSSCSAGASSSRPSSATTPSRSLSRQDGCSDPGTGSWRSWGSTCRWRPRSDAYATCGSSPAARPSSDAALRGREDRALVSVMDGLRAEKSPRWMAESIWGEARVDEEWSSESWMRSQVRRWIPKARALADGGWRDLVPRNETQPWRGATTVEPDP